MEGPDVRRRTKKPLVRKLELVRIGKKFFQSPDRTNTYELQSRKGRLGIPYRHNFEVGVIHLKNRSLVQCETDPLKGHILAQLIPGTSESSDSDSSESLSSVVPSAVDDENQLIPRLQRAKNLAERHTEIEAASEENDSGLAKSTEGINTPPDVDLKKLHTETDRLMGKYIYSQVTIEASTQSLRLKDDNEEMLKHPVTTANQISKEDQVIKTSKLMPESEKGEKGKIAEEKETTQAVGLVPLTQEEPMGASTEILPPLPALKDDCTAATAVIPDVPDVASDNLVAHDNVAPAFPADRNIPDDINMEDAPTTVRDATTRQDSGLPVTASAYTDLTRTSVELEAAAARPKPTTYQIAACFLSTDNLRFIYEDGDTLWILADVPEDERKHRKLDVERLFEQQQTNQKLKVEIRNTEGLSRCVEEFRLAARSIYGGEFYIELRPCSDYINICTQIIQATAILVDQNQKYYVWTCAHVFKGLIRNTESRWRPPYRDQDDIQNRINDLLTKELISIQMRRDAPHATRIQVESLVWLKYRIQKMSNEPSSNMIDCAILKLKDSEMIEYLRRSGRGHHSTLNSFFLGSDEMLTEKISVGPSYTPSENYCVGPLGGLVVKSDRDIFLFRGITEDTVLDYLNSIPVITPSRNFGPKDSGRCLSRQLDDDLQFEFYGSLHGAFYAPIPPPYGTSFNLFSYAFASMEELPLELHLPAGNNPYKPTGVDDTIHATADNPDPIFDTMNTSGLGVSNQGTVSNLNPH